VECSAVLRNGRYSQYWPKILCGRLRFCGRAEQSAKEPVVRDLPVACSVFRVRTNRSEQPPGRSDGTPRSGGAPITLAVLTELTSGSLLRLVEDKIEVRCEVVRSFGYSHHQLAPE